MQARLVTMEEGAKESSAPNIRPTNHSRVLCPTRILQFLLLLVVLCLGFSIIGIHMFKYFGIQTLAPMEPTILLSCHQDYSLENWIRPPSKLSHAMNDSELLWRASFAPGRKKFPFKRVPKIAFMFLTKGPLPLAPLWERFFKGHEQFYSIYVHALPNYKSDFRSSSAFYQRQIPSQAVAWGEMSMCDAERRLLANALLDMSNEWFVLLSESCIPLYSFNIMYHYLSRSRFSFMSSYDDKGPYGRGRYNPGMEPEVELTQWRKGSQWFEVNRKLAVDIIQDTVYYPKFQVFCKPACYVDEHYFPTMLTIESPTHLANRTLTWTDWSRGGAHPATFGKADITENFFKKMLEGQVCVYNNQQSTVCYLFARKFAPSALEPLLGIADKVFGF